MQVDRKANIVRNIKFGFIAKILLLTIQFIMKTVMIRILGILYLGLNSLFTSVLGILSLSELGIGSVLVFSMYRPVAEDDTKTICTLLNFYRKCYLIIGIIISIVGLFFLPFIKNFIQGDYPSDINLYVAYLLNLINTSIGYFLFSYRASIFEAYQRNDLTSKIDTITTLIQSLVQIVLLCLFRNYYLYLIIVPVFSLFRNILIWYISKSCFPSLQKLSKEKLDSDIFENIKKQFKGVLFHKLGNAVFLYADNLVISTFLGLKILGIYNNYYYIITALIGFITIISTSLIPTVGNGIIVNDLETNKKEYKYVNLVYYWIATIGAACLYCLYQPFMVIWMGNDLLLDKKTVFQLAFLFFVLHENNANGVYRSALGIWWEDRFRPIISALVNLGLNLFLIKRIGIDGVVISSVVSNILVDFPYCTYVLYKNYFKENCVNYILLQYFRLILMIPIVLVTDYACSYVELQGLVGLFITFIICFLISNFLFAIINIRNQYFRQFVLYFVGKIKGIAK